MAPKRKRGSQKEKVTPRITRGLLDARTTFDNLYDALNYDPAIDRPEDLDEYRRQWQQRRDLAELSRRPEGFVFRWRASDGRVYQAPLLTPPDMEAVQREDGTWFRTRRVIDENNPRPYSERWYAQYLHYHGLPTWFLHEGHLSMLTDGEESRRLSMFNAPSPQYAVIPRTNYLDLLYDGAPLFPERPQEGMYILELQTDGARASLAHHYPAMGITGFPYRTYVMPGGNIHLRAMVEAVDATVPSRADDEVEWEAFEAGQRILSSYYRESNGPHANTSPSELRAAAMQDAVDRHAIINPMEDPPGRGHMDFLDARDRHEARVRGYIDDDGFPDVEMVNNARREGELAVGTGDNAGPIVVFYPEERLRNPAEDPTGPGAWRFLTTDGATSNRGFAAINFGGSHGLPAYPTASQIRRLGRLFIADGREDLTDMIDIVWVPGEEDEDEGDDPVLDAAPATVVESEEEEAGPPRSRLRRRSPERSLPSPLATRYPASATTGHHPHQDPTNNGGIRGGMYDQTGSNHAEYATAEVRRGSWVTVDRSRAWPGTREDHKLWVYGARGWKKWIRADTMATDADWDNTKKVSDLNKHREQAYQRSGIWERKRPEKREDYRPEELDWAMDLIKAAGGERPPHSMEDLTAEFNRRFSTHRRRNETGITSLFDRLRKEYAEHGGLRPRKGRGWKQQQASKEMRGAASKEDDEEGEGGVEGEGEGGLEDQEVEEEGGGEGEMGSGDGESDAPHESE